MFQVPNLLFGINLQCLEKIAYTLYCESFQEEQGERKRMFETCMSEALQR